MTPTQHDSTTMHPQDWLRLILLSVLWGASFFFIGESLQDLPPLTIVLVRAALGAAILVPFFLLRGGVFPKSLSGWLPFLVMGALTNAIPFSLIVASQTHISSGMAAVTNATTPLFTALVLAAFGDERLIARRVVGVFMGLGGVIILQGAAAADASQTMGILLALGAALSYGFSGLWARRKLANVPPLTSAVLQLVCSSALMAVVAGVFDRPWTLPVPGAVTWLSLIGLATLSTALAYVVFFQILVRSGASNVMLVTLLVPVTAILLGTLVLGEPLTVNEVVGALVIGSALLVIDGRALQWLRRRRAAAET